jgi:hypothetical protein
MVAGIRSCLAAIGIDVGSEVSQGRLVLSSEPITSGEENFDVGLMLLQLEEALDEALQDGHKGLWATGDMTWEFGSEKNFAKLLEYEYRLEKLLRQRPELSGICQYHKDTMPCEAPRQALLTHRTIFINEMLSCINPHFIPSGKLSDQTTADAELDEMINAFCQLQSTK